MKQTLEKLFESKDILVLDGATATELEKMGCDLNDELWSAKVLFEDPEKIKLLHLNYFEAGADISISTSYQATFAGFMKRGYSEKEAKELIQKSVSLVIEARDQYLAENPNDTSPLIAGSIGPYGAYLADGSEYRGNYNVDDKELYEFHKNRMELILEAGAEILAIETIPSIREAVVTAKLSEELGSDCWISFSCKDEKHISEGDLISQCAIELQKIKSVKAIGINCTDPQYIEGLIRKLKSIWDGHIVVYPNKGEIYNADTKTWHGNENSKCFYEWSELWIKAGADIIGGCCRTGPEEIKEIKKAIMDIC